VFDKELLFKPDLPEDDVELPSGAGVVRVRALSRDEALAIRSGEAQPTLVIERLMIATGCVDPVLTVEEVERWQKARRNDELEAVSNRIAQLSKLMPESPKEVMRKFQDDPDAEFRVLPGAETRHDGGTPKAGTKQR
jgi:hypothetical protein